MHHLWGEKNANAFETDMRSHPGAIISCNLDISRLVSDTKHVTLWLQQVIEKIGGTIDTSRLRGEHWRRSVLTGQRSPQLSSIPGQHLRYCKNEGDG